jgi:surfeit locus 1 family protein
MADAWEPKLPPAERPPRPAGGFPFGLTIAVAIALSLLVGLGVWQLQRLKWKEGLLAHIAALQHAPPRPLDEVLGAGGDLDFVRVSFDCPDVLDRPRARLYSLRDGEIAYRQVTACPVRSGQAASILVDLGYEDCGAPKPAPPFAGPLVGILRKPDAKSPFAAPNQPDQHLWFWRDLPGMAKGLGAGPPAPVFVALEHGPQPGGRCRLTPAPIPTDIPNRHLEYALTWFGLAAVLAGVYAAMLFNRRKT